ncbi:MAG TPA: phospholipase D-like domain-containing protein [Blastocatellia bacterium]|jgi:phosphatidylserine/phosphatidylglycerophosphate/cardiolipin synthase-like enzyme|nr:phospholipase D-like domain-containing protein [Blastocatellia bacterium]
MFESYQQSNNLSLIIQPGDSFFPIVDAIDSARLTLRLTIFRMDDPVVRGALSRAVARGVAVRALVAPASKGWTRRNKRLVEDLSRLGVDVRTPNAVRERVKRYHYKVMMVDNAQSMILTFNPTQKNLHYARDFGLLVRDPNITTELNRLFDADWHGSPFKPDDLPLVISPHNSRTKLISLLESAQRSIRILDAKVEDQQVMGLLMRKAADGVDVKLIGRESELDQIVPNFHVRKLARYKLHAKCVVVDSLLFFIGSQNLRDESLDARREVGIIVQDAGTARKIERVFDEDWVNATEVTSGVGVS